jgi:TRAP-type C4-dicarboxylate transport system substrate-binding protein
MSRRSAVAALTAAALLCLAGCGSDEPPASPDEKSSAVTLRIATYDDREVSGGRLVDHFVEAVTDLDASITMEATYQAAPNEQATIELVQAGDADLVLVASRAWDLVGVDSLRAINAPFLIDSTELLNQVVAGDEATTMMKGLSTAKMTGLAMLPEALRHPFGTEASPLGPDDYDGRTLRSPHSKTTWGLLSSLGATPLFENDGYTMAESQFEQAPAPQGTGNVTFYAKADVIAIRDTAMEKLSAAQQDALREAAETTRDWAIRTFDDDAAAAAKYCEQGGKIVAATPAHLAALEDAAAPVMAELEKDPATAKIITAIETLKSGITVPAPITGCTATTATGKESLLNGTYRSVVTLEALERAGVTDPAALDDVPGINTTVLEDGSFHGTTLHTEGPRKGETSEGHSTYEYDGKTVIFHWSQSPTNCTKATVEILEDRSLAFSNIVECPEDEASLVLDQVGLRLWKRIG